MFLVGLVLFILQCFIDNCFPLFLLLAIFCPSNTDVTIIKIAFRSDQLIGYNVIVFCLLGMEEVNPRFLCRSTAFCST